MTESIALEVERAKAERKSPILLWLLNIVWPGLGNLVVGQVVAGLIFGTVHLLLVIGLSLSSLLGPLGFVMMVPGGFLCFINWIAASAVGHQWINRRYAKALEEIQAKLGSAPEGGV